MEEEKDQPLVVTYSYTKKDGTVLKRERKFTRGMVKSMFFTITLQSCLTDMWRSLRSLTEDYTL